MTKCTECKCIIKAKRGVPLYKTKPYCPHCYELMKPLSRGNGSMEKYYRRFIEK